MIMVFGDQLAVTPAGNPTGAPIPVAPNVVCVILGSNVPTHKVGLAEGAPAVLLVTTVIIPVALPLGQSPTKGILYVNVPVCVGTPEIVIVLPLKNAATPLGKPVGVPIPVAPVVVCVIEGVIEFPKHITGVEEGKLAVVSFTIKST